MTRERGVIKSLDIQYDSVMTNFVIERAVLLRQNNNKLREIMRIR